jgi:hypothetical protein
MKILIDATSIVNQPTGAGRYSYNILKNIARLDKNNHCAKTIKGGSPNF